MKQNNVKEVIKNDLCISCGLCSFICPPNAITMERNKYNELQPIIDNRKCIHCSKCLEICPNTISKLKKEALNIQQQNSQKCYGSDGYQYLSWDDNVQNRLASASGGAISRFATFLLENHYIAGVIHVERTLGQRKDDHYQACISNTLEELSIPERKSSAYQPIDFSKVLTQIDKNKRYLITATPCVINGLQYLIKNKNYHFITCALICSHNVNNQFMSYFADSLNITKDKEYYINLRAKNTHDTAKNFENHFYTPEHNLIRINRFESGWTNIWRNYYFAMNACNYCTDLWGHNAQISVKDAWGWWANKRPLGKSIVIIRDEEINKLFKASGLRIENLEENFFENHQTSSSNFKQVESYNKLFKPTWHLCNIKNGLLHNFIISKTSKLCYKYLGFNISKIILFCINKILERK